MVNINKNGLKIFSNHFYFIYSYNVNYKIWKKTITTF